MSHYVPSVPFKPTPRSPQATDALESVVALYEEKARLNAEVDERIAQAIKTAQEQGVSLRQIAERLELSPETVRKMGHAR